MAFTSMQSDGPELRRYLGWATLPLLLGLVLSSFAFAYWYFVSAQNIRGVQEIRQLSVTGEGKVAVKPDIALFNASVLTQAKKVGDAQAENTKRSNAVMAFLKSKGVEERDIKTVGYSVYPQYTYPEPPCYPGAPCSVRSSAKTPEIASYDVRHTIEIKIRNLDLVDDLLEGIVSSGANEVGSINFTFDKPEAVHAEARKKAIEDAKMKAETIARDMGVKLKRITGFSESGGGYPIFAYSAKAGIGGGTGGGDVATPEVSAGEQEIISNVTIMYEFR
ncbi:MAG: SIMPL domain-containing protein [Candidatus Sungbacteria bacterium]|nr:SIMPL domain-containing protein [Candidatus Sungbacteria bacterium]